MASRSRSAKSSVNQNSEFEKAKTFCTKGVDQSGLTKLFINDEIGYGVFTTKDFAKGSFIVEYVGDLISDEEAAIRNTDYELNNSGSFMYYFKSGKECLCIDGTMSISMGKFINDSVYANCAMKKIDVSGISHLCLFAVTDIAKGTEIRYNYNDKGLPWRKKPSCKRPLLLKDIKMTISDDGTVKKIDEGDFCDTFNNGESETGRDIIHTTCAKNSQSSHQSADNELYCIICMGVAETANTLCANGKCKHFLDSFCRACYEKHNCELVDKARVKEKKDSNVDFKCVESCYSKNGVMNIDLCPDIKKTCVVCCKNVTELAPCNAKQCADYLKDICLDCYDGHVCRKKEEDLSPAVNKKDEKINPKDIPVADICDMVERSKQKLLDIFTGKALCERHDRYKAGGRTKASLNMCIGFNVFTGEQENAICNALMQIFCKEKMCYFDYVMKVLLPESMALLCSEVMGVTIEKANYLLLNSQSDDENDGEESNDEDIVPKTQKKFLASIKKDEAPREDTNQKVDLKSGANRKSPRAMESKKKCPLKACLAKVYDLPRHMRLVHDWSKGKARSVNLVWKTRKPYEWKTSPPKRSKKSQWKKEIFGLESSTESSQKEKRRVPRHDYRKTSSCPFPGCYSVCKRIDQHLKNVHKLKSCSDEYKEYLQKAVVVKDLNYVEEWKKDVQHERREAIRENCGFDGTIPDFRDYIPETSVTYVPESKKNARVFALRDVSEDSSTISESEITNEEVFKKFKNFLTSVDGGRLDISTAVHAVSNTKSVLKALETDDLSQLLERNKIRDEFLGKHCVKQKYAPLTIKKYLTSIMHFYDFLINEEMLLKNYTADDIVRIKVRASNWSRSYNPAAREHEAVRYEEELDVLLTPDQIKQYESSQDARDAIKLFGDYSSSSCPTLSQADYCIMREYLLVQISLQNSHRSGVLSNMTIEEFDKGQTEGEMIRIKVRKHKTARIYGPAKLYVKKHLYDYLKIFVSKARSQIRSSAQNVFVTFNGTQMESGQISRQINSTWQRAGVYGENRPSRNLTCTMFRKSASTAVLEHNPECGKDVADLLLHSEKTQKKHYDVRRRELSTARGASHVGNLLRFKSVTSPKKIKLNNSDIQVESPRRKWTDNEIEEIEKLFADSIKEEMVTMEIVRAMSADFKYLNDVPLKKIYDKIRSIYNNKTKESSSLDHLKKESLRDRLKRISVVPEENLVDDAKRSDGSVSTENDEEFIPPSNCTSSSNKIFLPEDVKLMLRKYCKSIISAGPISKSRITETLEGSEEGKLCLQHYTMAQIQSRLKWERRVKNRK